MTSSYTPLGVEKMVTGENAGTWGTKTNTNLDLIEQISGGYISQAIAGSGSTTFSKADGATGAVVATRVIEFTGALSGSRIVTFPVLTENFYIIKNSTTGAETLQLKAATGSGATVTWATTDKGWKIVYFDGVSTNTGVYDILSAVSNIQLTNQNELRLGDADNSAYAALKAAATTTSYTLTMPAAIGASGTTLVTTDGSGTLGFTATSTFGITTGKAIAMAMIFG
jgi:hypothetical protein|tara:strand:+ start:859 stop:1536 length:678 start_codon:yes stop_codon:yes gene_type:complete